jgi:hypothetical protein
MSDLTASAKISSQALLYKKLEKIPLQGNKRKFVFPDSKHKI